MYWVICISVISRLFLSSGSTKLAKANVEPLVEFLVQLVALVLYLPGGEPLLHGLGGGAVLLCAADVEHIVPLQLGKPSEHIHRESTAPQCCPGGGHC